MENSQNIKNEILGLEKKYWKAMTDHNLNEAVSLTSFPCLVAGATGLKAVDRAQFEKMFDSQKDTFRDVKIEESKAEVQQIASDTAIIAYTVHTSVEKDGKTEAVDAVDTSTWIRRGDKWLCAMHTETMLQH